MLVLLTEISSGFVSARGQLAQNASEFLPTAQLHARLVERYKPPPRKFRRARTTNIRAKLPLRVACLMSGCHRRLRYTAKRLRGPASYFQTFRCMEIVRLRIPKKATQSLYLQKQIIWGGGIEVGRLLQNFCLS